MENSGWRTKDKQIPEGEQEESELKHLSIKTGENEQVTAVKSFNVPIDFPFDISDNTFEIRYNDDMYTESAAYDDYIYSFNGKLLAEFYNHFNCVRTKKQFRFLAIPLALISTIFRRCLNA